MHFAADGGGSRRPVVTQNSRIIHNTLFNRRLFAYGKTPKITAGGGIRFANKPLIGPPWRRSGHRCTMDDKVKSILEKARLERKKAQFPRALKRLEQAIEKFPDELDLYVEAADVALDAGESRQTTQFLKRALDRFPDERAQIQDFARGRINTTNDPVLARFVLDAAVKVRDLEEARHCLDQLNDHGVRDLLQRIRNKKETLHAVEAGGYQFRGALLGLGICELLISLRLDRFKEAVTLACAILGEKPTEHVAFTPFFELLGAEHPRSGRIRLAYARSLMAAGRPLEALDQLLDAARTEGAVTAPCIEFAREIECDAPEFQGRLRRALPEMLLLRGEVDEAVAILGELLAESPEYAGEVVELLQPRASEPESSFDLRLLFGDAALQSGKPELAASCLEAASSENQRRVFELLEDKKPEALARFHGELALRLGEYERAAVILGGLCRTSPTDAAAVLRLIEPHRDAHPDLAGLMAEHTTPSTPGSSRGSGGGFEHFENQEFSLSGSSGGDFVRDDERATRPAPVSTAKDTSRPRFTQPIGGHEIDWDDLAPDDGPRDESVTAKTPETTEKADEPAPPDEPAATGQPDPPRVEPATVTEQTEVSQEEPTAATEDVTEAFVVNVSHRLRESGAATFFHVVPDEATGDEEATESVNTDTDATPDGPRADDASFDDRFGRFQRGELSNGDVIALIDAAFASGRLDAVRQLLCFEPTTDAEAFVRRLKQAEYQLATDQPREALKLLRMEDAENGPEQHRHDIGVKIAVCQRMLRDYAGAHETLERMCALFPDSVELERLARKNYEQYQEVQCTDAQILEKTTSLHVDD